MRIVDRIREMVQRAINEVFGVDVDVNFTFPPDTQLGDLAFGCFALAKQLRLAPALIAARIAAVIHPDEVVATGQASGPYLNITLHSERLFGDICAEVVQEGEHFGWSDQGQAARVMVEYSSPNTNKPLHLGHVRNGCLGMAVSNLLSAVGNTVIRANLINDRGVHICKSMLAWSQWGDGQSPQSTGTKGDHFVGNWYVRYATELELHPEIEDRVQDLLRRWEASDPAVLTLWSMMNSWVYEGFDKTYRDFGFLFDVVYHESETYLLGKDIIDEGLRAGVFVRDESGAVIAILPVERTVIDAGGKPTTVTAFGTEKNGSPKRTTVLRADGTSVYMTQDLGTAVRKFDEHALDRSIYVVGSEQDHHFRVLFELLRMLGYDWASECHHLSYGMVDLPDGKMKSREGNVVDADDLLEEMTAVALTEIKVRDNQHPIPDAEADRRARVVALAAIKFFLLQVSADQKIRFDPAASIAFEGRTGPYCLYTYARAATILDRADQMSSATPPDFARLGNTEERLLIQKIAGFPHVVARAAEQLNPGTLAEGVYDLAKTFNSLYQKHTVFSDDESLARARVGLVRAAVITLKNGLNLLGIDVLEQM